MHVLKVSGQRDGVFANFADGRRGHWLSENSRSLATFSLEAANELVFINFIPDLCMWNTAVTQQVTALYWQAVKQYLDRGGKVEQADSLSNLLCKVIQTSDPLIQSLLRGKVPRGRRFEDKQCLYRI